MTRARPAKHYAAGLPRRSGAFRRSLAAVALAGALAWPGAAAAGLGPIRVLSAPGAPFSALIPLVDRPPEGDLQIGLADRNRYPMLSPYSLSASRLSFILQRGADGRPLGILVSGPADLSESELDFAVSLQWEAGGAVREYQVLRPKNLAASFVPPTQRALPVGGFASLGLGELTVDAAPGQAFVASAELFGLTRGMEDRLRVRLVPEPGMTDDPAAQARLLAAIRHVVSSRPDGALVLRLSAPMPLRQARLAFRLDVAVGRAHLARRYLMSAHGARYVVAEQTLSGPASAFRVLRVAPGSSLSEIAARLRPASVPLQQAMDILHRDNPQAFSGGDRDRLLAGSELKYPESWSVTARVDRPAASGEVPHAAPDAARVVPEAPRPSRTAVAAAALKARLREQDRLLSEAHATSRALQDRLESLRRKAESAHSHAAASPAVATAPARTPASAPHPASALPVSPALMGSAGAAVLAAAATALALRRRRLARAGGRRASEADANSPTVEGMRQWLRYDPARDDLRYRLLQLLASQDDRQGFLVEAEEARRRFGEDSPMWQGVVSMGRELAPEHPWTAAPVPTPVVAAGPVAAVSAIALVPDAAPVPAVDAALPPSAPVMPERPLSALEELEALAGDGMVFREDLNAPLIEDAPPAVPEPIDTRALAQLYLEMGDTEAANALLRSG